VERVRELFARREEPYAGVDLGLASRLGSAIWIVGGLMSVILLPLAPPTDPLGDAGWIVAALVVIGAIGIALRLRSLGPRVHVDELLANSYAALIALGLLT
jgi:NADH:ubiquinone oxidoreductase subunit H